MFVEARDRAGLIVRGCVADHALGWSSPSARQQSEDRDCRPIPGIAIRSARPPHRELTSGEARPGRNSRSARAFNIRRISAFRRGRVEELSRSDARRMIALMSASERIIGKRPAPTSSGWRHLPYLGGGVKQKATPMRLAFWEECVIAHQLDDPDQRVDRSSGTAGEAPRRKLPIRPDQDI